MRKLPELPLEWVKAYWVEVRSLLVAGGMTPRAAATAVRVYREWMKPAGWTIYNDSPEDSAAAAKDYAAWMRELKEQGKEKEKPAKSAGK